MNDRGNMGSYFGKYADFQTVSKSEAGQLLGPDNMVGDILKIDPQIENEEHRAWLVNQFNKRVGYLDPEVSREISLQAALGCELQAVLSFVAFTDHPDEGHYWGQVAVICFESSLASSFEPFIKSVSKKMGEGVRVKVDLGPDAVQHIISSNGEWLPSQTVPMPKVDKGTAILKKHRSINDKLIAQGRSGNKGCYFASWIVLLAVVTLVIFGLKSCYF